MKNYIIDEGTNYTEKEQNCVTRSQVKEELYQHVEEHCVSFIVKSVKKRSRPSLRRAKAIF